MPAQRLTYQKLDQDKHPSKFTPEVYFNARDVRVISTEGNNAGNLSPETGNEISFTIPSEIENQPLRSRFKYADITDTFVYKSYKPGSPAASVLDSHNIQIIGYAVINDIIIIFSTDDSNQGQIWTYQDSTLELIYNNKLNFSIDYPIRDYVTRVENDLTYKIYFTDNNNELRYVNIKDPELINRPADYLNLSPTINYSRINLDSISNSSGADFQGKLVQYAYTLYNYSGSESALSPLSDLFTLKNVNTDENYTKTLNLSFTINSDSIFTNYKIYRLEYTSYLQEPTVTLIYDSDISSTTISFSDDGILNLATYSIEELLFLGNTPFVCQSLSVHSNKLIAGNITETSFDVDYDARAYRFDDGDGGVNSPTARIDDVDLGVTYFTGNPIAANIPEDHDCINPSNTADTNLDYRNNTSNTNILYNKYIYQADGITLGGTGVNVSYKIMQDTIPFNSPSSIGLPLDLPYNSPINANVNKSYKRDEIYRFGIRFYNDKGQRSFVKWIGDIRMPNQHTHPIVVDDGNFVSIKPLYVEFTVKLNSLPDEVTGYEIVRVERTANDRTIVAQGIVSCLIQAPPLLQFAGALGPAGRRQPSYCVRSIHSGAASFYGHSISHQKNITDDVELDSDGRATTNNYTLDSQYLQLWSPEIEYNELTVSDLNYINIIGGLKYHGSIQRAYKDNVNTVSPVSHLGGHRASAWLGETDKYGITIPIKLSNIESNIITSLPLNGITSAKITNESVITFNAFNSFSTTEIFYSSYIQASDTNTRKIRSTTGNSVIMSIKDSSALGIENAIQKTGYTSVFTTESTPTYITVDLKVNLISQYGGNRYNARSNNNYISVNYSVKPNLSTAVIEARQGDTYINFYTCQTQSAKLNNADITPDVTYREILSFPVETTINLDAKNNLEYNSWNKLIDLSIGYDDDKLYSYNPVFNTENNVTTSSSKPRNFNTISNFYNRVIASDTKINGEQVDSWLKFRTNNFLDLEGSLGSVNALEEFNDVIFAFQDTGVAQLLLQPNVSLSSAEGVAVQLGTGTFLYDYKYLTTSSGTKNQFSVQKSINGIYYFDTLNKKIKLLGQGDKYLSDIAGLHSWLRTNIYKDEIIQDNPFKNEGISTYYNKQTLEAGFTFRTNTTTDTIVFNELLNGFTAFHSYASPMYIYVDGHLYSLDNTLNGMWKHNANTFKYYNVAYSPSVSLVTNADGLQSKTFNSLIFDSEYGTVDNLFEILESVRIYNSYQDSGIIPITSSNLKRRFRQWFLALPREQNSRNRIVSHYATIQLIFKPGNTFSMSDCVVDYTHMYV